MSELQCYNRGCGKKYNPAENTDESCRHHPGDPVFHDAYKGWSCCNKKCTDFTEFLNIKGCTLSKHSNIKPPEPEKPVNNVPDVDVIEVKPIVKPTIERPPYDTPMVKMTPEIAPSLKSQITSPPIQANNKQEVDDGVITVGTMCKNGGCQTAYEGPASDLTECVYHPGVPVFHEGLKFWTCCQKRTSDFNAFLAQVGCETGKHIWKKKDDNTQNIQCRWDFHQTGTHVVVSIYAKQYCPSKSEVHLNPVRLQAKVVFPEQNGGAFLLDHELHGIVDVSNSMVTMYGTKVEIKMRKGEPGSWPRLEIIKKKEANAPNTPNKKTTDTTLETQVESVDLSDL